MIDCLDHVVVAVRDLAAATERTQALLGRPPAWRGVHPGAGTANALFTLDNTALELLTPDGEGGVGDLLRSFLDRSGEGMLALAFGTSDAADCAARLEAAGLVPRGPEPGEGRDVARGAVRRWRSVWLSPVATRGLVLFAIERESPSDGLSPAQPLCEAAAAVSALDHVVVLSPELEASRALYADALGLRLALDRSFERRGLRILFFRVGGATLEVVGKLAGTPGEPGSDGFAGIAWRVPDVDAARARLSRQGFDVSAVREGAKPGTRVCTVRSDTCGVPTLVIA